MTRPELDASDPTVMECPICHKLRKEGSSAANHMVQGHKTPLEDAKAQYPAVASKLFYPKKAVVIPVALLPTAPEAAIVSPVELPLQDVEVSPDSIVDEMMAGLNISERQAYDEMFDTVFQQVDRDMSLVMTIHNLCRSSIDLIRLQNDWRDHYNHKRFKEAKFYQDCIKATGDNYRSYADSLGITRIQKLKSKEQVKSSPATLISAYLNELELMTPAVLQKMALEEQSMYAEMAARVKRDYLDSAADIEEEQIADEPQVYIESVLGREDIPF